MALGVRGWVSRNDKHTELVAALRAVARGETHLPVEPVRRLLADRIVKGPVELYRTTRPHVLTRREEAVLKALAAGLTRKASSFSCRPTRSGPMSEASCASSMSTPHRTLSPCSGRFFKMSDVLSALPTRAPANGLTASTAGIPFTRTGIWPEAADVVASVLASGWVGTRRDGRLT